MRDLIHFSMRAKRLIKYIFWKNSGTYKQSSKLFTKTKKDVSGKRCVVIGNGPSLRNMDLSFLKDEVTIGTNRIYLAFDRIKTVDYYICVNPLVVEQFAHEICTLEMPKFFNWNSYPKLAQCPESIFLFSHELSEFKNGDAVSIPKLIDFSKDINGGVWIGATVTFVALQIAYSLGYRQIILIGVDHNFVTKGAPHKIVTSDGEDPNHFTPDYFGKGIKWGLPDLETSAYAYQLAKVAFEEDGGEILDATVDGKLDIFPKANYQDIFKID